MNKLFTIFSFLLLAACNPSAKKSDSQDEAKTKTL